MESFSATQTEMEILFSCLITVKLSCIATHQWEREREREREREKEREN